jgi:hypothetical protein
MLRVSMGISVGYIRRTLPAALVYKDICFCYFLFIIQGYLGPKTLRGVGT